MKRFGLIVLTVAYACGGGTEPGVRELVLLQVDGELPPVTIEQTTTVRVEVLGGTLRGRPNDDDCTFRLTRRTTPTNGSPVDDEATGDAACEWIDEARATALIRLPLGTSLGTIHSYTFAGLFPD